MPADDRGIGKPPLARHGQRAGFLVSQAGSG